ncbi:MAG TPA: hypothetical protein PKH71_03660, partial [Methanoregulaceae archaeon]|nr:hypothetical protein [Methanoregulaceae archaeon]
RVGTVSFFSPTIKSGAGWVVEVPGAVDGEGGSEAEGAESSEVQPEKRIIAPARHRSKGTISSLRMMTRSVSNNKYLTAGQRGVPKSGPPAVSA